MDKEEEMIAMMMRTKKKTQEGKERASEQRTKVSIWFVVFSDIWENVPWYQTAFFPSLFSNLVFYIYLPQRL